MHKLLKCKSCEQLGGAVTAVKRAFVIKDQPTPSLNSCVTSGKLLNYMLPIFKFYSWLRHKYCLLIQVIYKCLFTEQLLETRHMLGGRDSTIRCDVSPQGFHYLGADSWIKKYLAIHCDICLNTSKFRIVQRRKWSSIWDNQGRLQRRGEA